MKKEYKSTFFLTLIKYKVFEIGTHMNLGFSGWLKDKSPPGGQNCSFFWMVYPSLGLLIRDKNTYIQSKADQFLVLLGF